MDYYMQAHVQLSTLSHDITWVLLCSRAECKLCSLFCIHQCDPTVWSALYTSSHIVQVAVLWALLYIRATVLFWQRDPPSTLSQRCTCFHGALCGFSGSHQCRNIQLQKTCALFQYRLCVMHFYTVLLCVTHSRVKIANFTNNMCVKCV